MVTTLRTLAAFSLLACLLTAASGSVLSWSTYFGGSGMDSITAVAVDRAGNVYVAGWTDSSNLSTAGPAGSGRGGGTDVFVAKWGPGGGAPVYCRYLGGRGNDSEYGIAVDNSGNAYVTGSTSSPDFPVKGALPFRLSGGRDAFVAKLDPSGNLVYSTYLGGNASDSGNAIAVDASGRAYVAGETTSSNFPVLSAFQASYRGQSDVFLSVLSQAGNQLIYSTYLGGMGDDHGRAIAVDSAGNAYVTGDTTSTDFPTAKPFQGSSGGNQDAFVSKISPDGRTLVYSTYLGGSSIDFHTAVAVDSQGNAYVTGYTVSTDFTAVNALQPRQAGSYDAFLAKIAADGRSILESTFLGGSQSDSANALALDQSGIPYVAGQTFSADFPLQNPGQRMNSGSMDAFIARLAPLPQYAGSHDEADCNLIAGWAWDGSNPNSPVNVDILDGTVLLATVAANQFRPDLLNAGLGNGYHAFNYPTPPSLFNGQPHSIRVRISPNGIDLSGTPKSLTCSRFTGYVDTASCTVVAGWGWDMTNPNTPINVDILDGAVLLGTVSASQ